MHRGNRDIQPADVALGDQGRRGARAVLDEKRSAADRYGQGAAEESRRDIGAMAQMMGKVHVT